MADDIDNGLLFENVTFTIIPSNQLHSTAARQLIDAIQASGGKYVPLRDDNQEIDDIESLSHIIAHDVDFPSYARALELGIYVVVPKWVSASIQRKRKTSERQYSPDPAQFFRDVVVTCAGLPDGDQEAIFAGVMALGGSYSYRLTKLVTHIVTTDFDHDICVFADRMDTPAVKVLPHWFHDCFRLGKKIREKPYSYPDPEILRPNIEKTNVKIVPSPHLEGATTPSPTKMPKEPPPPSPSAMRKNLNAFMSRKVFLSDDLQLSTDFVRTIERLVNHGGGLLTTKLEEADIYIGQFRQGSDYIAASQARKEVASLSWLYHVINRNKYVSPLRKLFHYPLPPKAIRGFEGLKISLSNYAGDARIYVENLIKHCGAEYTKTMKQDNTHLVTAHKHGEKCEAAREWGIEVINHLWLEESFAKCSMQTMSNSKYTTFPARTNLGEVTGLTSLDMKCVEREFFPKLRSTPKKMAPKQSPRTHVPEPGAAVSTATDADAEVDLESEAQPKTAGKARGRPRRSSLMDTPQITGRENDSPALNSTGRASKLKALDTLHLQAPDIISFQKEMKRKGGVVHGEPRHSNAAATSSTPQRHSRKRRSDEYDVSPAESDGSEGEHQDATVKLTKRAKTGPGSALPPIQWRMMVTGDDRWSENPKKESTDKNTLRSLGILLTQDPKDVDILVAPKILRTRKFVSALACAPLVVDTTYLDHLLSKKKTIKNPPLLEDRDSEERMGFGLAEALERARQNKRKLFRGWDIFVTKDVNGGFDTYRDIIQLNGGVAMMYQGRSGLNATRRPSSSEDDEGHIVYLVSGKTDGEKKSWKKFQEEMLRQNLEARIVTTDWVLNAAMSQKILLEDKWVLDVKASN